MSSLESSSSSLSSSLGIDSAIPKLVVRPLGEDMDSHHLIEGEGVEYRGSVFGVPRCAAASCCFVVGVIFCLTTSALVVAVVNRGYIIGVEGTRDCGVVGKELSSLSSVSFNKFRMCADDSWMVVLRKDVKNLLDFNRTWPDYKAGFGDSSLGRGEFWLGLDALHWLTIEKKRSMRIKMNWMKGDFEKQEGRIAYDGFAVGDEKSNYVLSIGNITHHFRIPNYRHDPFRPQDPLAAQYILDGMQFTTRDRQNDFSNQNCAKKFSGGWWFNNCFYICLTCGPQHAPWYDGARWYYFNSVEMHIKID